MRDDGIGFDVAAQRDQAVRGASLGLLSMQERAALAGGGLKMMIQAQKDILPKLNLTKEQQEQINSLNQKTEADAKSLRKENKGDKDAMKLKVRELMESYHKALFAILNAQQQSEFHKEMQAFMKKWHEEHKGNKVGNPPPALATTAKG